MDMEAKAQALREAIEGGASNSDLVQMLAEVQAAERERLLELEAALEALVNRCNAEFALAAEEAVIAAEAALERLHLARKA